MSHIKKRKILGIDIGGANIKAALIDEEKNIIKIAHLYTPLWKSLDTAAHALKEIRSSFGITKYQFITMTGELSDIFDNRKEGVSTLAELISKIFPKAQIEILTDNMNFVSCRKLNNNLLSAASANWLATATLVSKRIRNGILLDFGSTTTDIIPIKNFSVASIGKTDHERLLHGELLYTGFTRTPLMALSQKIIFQSNKIPLMAESFANTGDIYRILGSLPKYLDIQETADGKNKTFNASCQRLARMIGLDKENANVADWKNLAKSFYKIQERIICRGCLKAIKSFTPKTQINIITAGSGAEILEKMIKSLVLALGNKRIEHLPIQNLISFKKDIKNYEIAACASAIAVADSGLDLCKSDTIL